MEIGPDRPIDEEILVDEINTNLLGMIRVASAFIPHLNRQSNAVLLNVSSGLAFVPLARFAVYCATKAAIHSFTLSLRHQSAINRHQGNRVNSPLRRHGARRPRKTAAPGGPQPMPLRDFIMATMKELKGESDEIAIGDARKLLAATNPTATKNIFLGMNR